MDMSARAAFLRFPSRPPRSPFDELTPRELEIAKALASGERMAEIGLRLGITPKTASTHKYRIYDKLGVSSERALMAEALRFGLVGGDADAVAS
jgi:two-component system invasion response regulator UvrY